MINLDEYTNVGTHCFILLKNVIAYFDSFGVEYIPEEIKDFIEKFPVIQEDNSIMCGHFCIVFIDFMLAGKKLTDYANLFSPYDFKKNNSIILSYFKNE